jgi:hypothetical protein
MVGCWMIQGAAGDAQSSRMAAKSPCLLDCPAVDPGGVERGASTRTACLIFTRPDASTCTQQNSKHEIALSQLMMLRRGNFEDLPTHSDTLEVELGRMLPLCLPKLHG